MGRTHRLGLVVVLGVSVWAAGACSGGTASDSGAQRAADATTTLAPRTTAAIPTDCERGPLQVAVRVERAGATVTKVICESPYAVATITGAEGITGDGVAFFRFKDNAWLLLASGPAADAARLAPETFSSSMVAQWIASRTIVPTTVTTAPPPPTPVPTSELEAVTTSTVAPTTTLPPPTTAAPTTTARPVPSTFVPAPTSAPPISLR